MNLMNDNSARAFFLGFALLACLCLFTACSPVLKVAVAADGVITYSVESSVSPLIEDTVRSFTGAQQELPLFNKAQILQALKSAGLSFVGVETPSTSSLIVSARIEADSPPIAPVTNLADGAVCQDMVPQVSGAIGYCHSSEVGERKLVLTISPQVLQQVMAIMPLETAEYLDLLSAPILTGEQLSASEYTDLISIIYGGSVARELQAAKVKILVTAPAPVQSAAVSHAAGTVRTQGPYVEFTLGLPELLSNLGQIEFTVEY